MNSTIQSIFILKCDNCVNIGDIVFYVANVGMAGIFHYQYAGIIKSSFDDLEYHLFLSEYMVSTLIIKVGCENRNILYNRIFATIEMAKRAVTQMRQQPSED